MTKCLAPTAVPLVPKAGQRDVMWLHKSLAVRIRREDSIWAELEDDYPWHETQDQKISFRPDPWNIYKQEFPESK